MYVFKVAVVGAGTMGGEIAQVIASSEIPVVLKDVEPELVEHGLGRARQVTERQGRRLVEKRALTEEQAVERLERTLGRITPTTDYGDFGDVDLVVEAVPERMGLKRAVFAELDAATGGHAILASNTSGLSITELAEATRRPDKVVGFHFFFPASVMRLIEVVHGSETSGQTVRAATNFAIALRKQPIRCREDPGFVVNRILTSAMSELWRAQAEEGLGPEEVDRVVRESGAAPMGPFFLADLLGLDTVLAIVEQMRESYGGRFYVSPAMRELVEASDLGRKTGKGFYEHGS
jgi:3-hydroxyacyl-CoA dehydrogenase